MAKARDEKDIVEMFEQQFTRSEDKFSSVKKHWKEDNDFSLGEQWDASTKNKRSVAGKERPCLTVNKIDPLVHRIVNEAKQQKLVAEVKPVDDTSDPDTALILSGLIRNTEYVSNAVRAYMWAYECAIRAGVGYFLVRNEYEDDDSFDQTVRIKRIKNPLCVSFDPDAEEQNGSDATFGILSDEISKQAADNLCKGVGYDNSDVPFSRSIWCVDQGAVRHGEIYWQECEDDELFLLTDGSKVRRSDISKEAIDLIQTKGLIAKSRKVQKKTIWYANIVEGKVIEKVESNSKYIPIVRMVGREGYINGKIDFRGITRNSMDSNRMYNVMSSLLVERIGLAPRAPYIGAAGQFEGFEEQWLNANNENLPKLEYNPITLGGNLAPPPSKNDASSGDPTIERYLALSNMDIKDTSSLSDAFMGNKSNETSSLAIKARAGQSGLATYDFLDNASDSIEHGARICIDMYSRIMGEREIVRILGEDYKPKIINLKRYAAQNGKEKIIDLTAGKFDVEIVVSSGDKTRRETAIEQLSFVLQTNPEAANLIMDIFVGNLDIKDADKVAKRFKALLPPNVIAAEQESEKDNPELDALQAHAEEIISGIKAQLEEAMAKLQDAELQLKSKEGELEIKREEVKLKRREIDLKELDMTLKRNAEEESEEGETKENDNSEQVGFIVKKLHGLEAELDMVTDVLEQLKGTAQQEVIRPIAAQTQDNGLPPAEAENNVGVPNG